MYKEALRHHLNDEEMLGRFAVCHVDRNPERVWGGRLRTDGLIPCLRAGHHMVYLISLGRPRPEVSRLMHPAEACLAQGAEW